MTLKEPQDLLAQELKEIYSAERQLYRALPKLGKAIPSDRLGVMLERRRERGSQLMEAIDDALEEISTSKARKKNVAVEAIIEDANAHTDEIRDDAMLQVAILGSLQKIEHYCIAAWGTSASLGRLFNQPKVVEAMERALEEGKLFDEELTQLAENEINPAMLGEGEKPGDDQEEGDKGGSRSGRRKSAA